MPLPAIDQRRHAHILTKDPRRFGYMCAVLGCRHFKPVAEFDAIPVLAHRTVGGDA